MYIFNDVIEKLRDLLSLLSSSSAMTFDMQRFLMIMLRWRQPNEILKTKETIDTSHVQSFKKSVFLDLAKVHFSQEGPKIKRSLQF